MVIARRPGMSWLGEANRAMRVDEPRLATDDLFGPLADEYEAWYATPLGAFVIALEERALLDALPDAVGRLIEIGAGTGWWTRTLARRGFTVTAVEPSAPMRRVGAARGQGPIEWLAGRAEQLPVPDDSFDVVLLMTVLEFVSGPERARRSTNSRQNPWYPYNAAPGSPPPRRCG